MDFVTMLNDIKENPELLDTFDDQCLKPKDIEKKQFNKFSNI
jgi:hypothetical protein